ncbi:MAG: flagellar hook-basal body protein, partial [Pseudomonadota bacterium]
DTLANNIANMNTHGFKRLNVKFSEMVNLALSDDPDLTTSNDVSGVRVDTNLSITDQGVLQQTDHPLDVALEGQGFIELIGPNGQSILWRGGRLSINEDRYLSGPDQLMLATQINIPDDATALDIRPSGDVTVIREGGDSEVLGQIGLLRLMDETMIVRMDGGLYALSDANAAEHATATEAGMGAFVQGSLERSNVDLNREMIDMMIVQRAYSANAQVVQAADEIASIANNLRR